MGFDTIRSMLELDNASTVGPADYQIERLIGKKNVIQSHI
jgi:hypothetical protein